MMWIAIGTGIIILGEVLFILAWLKSSHEIRYRDGYDTELAADYQAMMEQFGKHGK